MVMTGPMSESGSMIALTREPSGRRASTRGLVSSMRRPMGVMIRSMIRSTCSSLRNVGIDAQDLAGPLDVDVVRAVDHDLGDRVVEQERLDRPEARDLVDDLLDEGQSFGTRHGEAALADDPVDDGRDPAADLGRVVDVHQRLEGANDFGLNAAPDLGQHRFTTGKLRQPRSNAILDGGRFNGDGLAALSPRNPFVERHA